MNRIKKIIFGKVYDFQWTEDFNDVVIPTVSLYPDALDESSTNIRVNLSTNLPSFNSVSINPKLHKFASGEMLTLMGSLSAAWRHTQDGGLTVDVAIPKATEPRQLIRKLASMEFPSPLERFEQLLHELVLVPSVYFSHDTAPIHCAAVATSSGALLLAGTGGVGKSSAVIAFREQKDVHFIADDIAVISADGTVYGNMAWPKIYGYNCAGNDMSREILEGRGLVDRMHFHFRNRLDPSRVRRKIAPDRLYQSVLPQGRQLGNVFYLFKENVPRMTVSPLPLENAIEMSVAVMESEYGIFHRHLNWELYNSLGSNTPPLLTMSQVKSNWRDIYRSAFVNANLFKVSIPLDIDHARYQTEIVDLVTR